MKYTYLNDTYNCMLLIVTLNFRQLKEKQAKKLAQCRDGIAPTITVSSNLRAEMKQWRAERAAVVFCNEGANATCEIEQTNRQRHIENYLGFFSCQPNSFCLKRNDFLTIVGLQLKTLVCLLCSLLKVQIKSSP